MRREIGMGVRVKASVSRLCAIKSPRLIYRKLYLPEANKATKSIANVNLFMVANTIAVCACQLMIMNLKI